MFFWLFTTGREILGGCLLPLICLTALLPILAAALMGAGIRRTGQDKQTTRRDIVLRLLAHLVILLGITSVYLTLMSDFSLRHATDVQTDSEFIRFMAGGPPTLNQLRLFMAGVLWLLALGISSLALQEGLRQGGWLRERVDRLRSPIVRRGSLGSSHFCTMREYRRYRRPDSDGVTFLGAFWGERKLRLDYGAGTFHLSGEDAARGILTLGGAGSGKTQGVILPVIGDRMLAGHSLVIADPQGELKEYVLRFARVTGHLVALHDPTSSAGPRYNLAEGIANVSDARAIADVLVPNAQGDNKFWSDSAAALLAACLIRFDTLGDIYNALNDLKKLLVDLEQDGPPPYGRLHTSQITQDEDEHAAEWFVHCVQVELMQVERLAALTGPPSSLESVTRFAHSLGYNAGDQDFRSCRRDLRHRLRLRRVG
ncbi:MAG: type IV secretion system DNA-binding domain-containing protein [Chloroflexi bacterium]|nr:type IV secretion system DNA-binding domain-containing protein [Chloroflexota bacterium]